MAGMGPRLRPSGPWQLGQVGGSTRPLALPAASAMATAAGIRSCSRMGTGPPRAPSTRARELLYAGTKMGAGRRRSQKKTGAREPPSFVHRCRAGNRLDFLRCVEIEPDLVVAADVDGHPAPVGELAEQKLVGKRLADGVLNQPRHWPRAHLRIGALDREGT